jgi:hypothetical protein
MTIKLETLGHSAGLIALSLAVLFSCSDEDRGDDGSALDEGPIPCEVLTCGASCTGDGDCATGLHCGADNHCTANCVSDVRCAVGEVCTDRGRCRIAAGADVFGDGGLRSDASGTGNEAGNANGCVDVEIKLERQIPNVVLLIDQSGSMDQTFGGERTDDDSLRRWNILRTALMHPDNGIVKRLERDVRFGLALYTSHNGGATCPVLTEVAVGAGNYVAIDSVYSRESWEDDTPTGEAVDAVATQLQAYQMVGPKVIVLATDGEPDNCTNPDAHDDTSRQLSVDAVTRAFDDGILTFVISVGRDIGEDHLRQVANAGQGIPLDDTSSDRFYRADNQTQLESAFGTIIHGVRNCVFELNGTVQKGRESEGTVLLDGTPQPYDDPNGWRLNTPSEIELLGTACESIKTGDHDLDISFPCGAVDVIR